MSDSPKMRLIPVSATSSKRWTFARNLTQLLELVPSNMRQAAEQELGVTYKWLRRMVSTGLSRPDARSGADLERLAKYFALPSIMDLWRPNLFCWLLQEDAGGQFRKKFRPQIERLMNEEGDRADRINSEQEGFDYARLEAMRKMLLPHHVMTGSSPYQLPWAPEELRRCLQELNLSGLTSQFEEWRRGQVSTVLGSEGQRRKTGTDEDAR